ncbi:MAG: hypothetical protein AUJ52_14130 [Elusimicrobia bacterium CG1_02_63_36]|nr:MAG: hypothetical protein AUJ52_14130 [Elusimicrobia bacterium CG1_02_63_36]PIP81448.1 MAG: hypothetical protein COR54_20130 [Elusimicrobia bacterium CG22_combo_CG10-13_8_21_14_all_63_91]PJA17051.1 MAG: hypothetical protein COX66_05980 [Elusimicrobia bacterium CG_4_10_14_0_2_um_filter_63_34]PJB25082.1 MAG: hypothetical protein CO113_10470 [Elusimicrobia bacterium CG_4_9_14_3_um_filter_62_55]
MLRVRARIRRGLTAALLAALAAGAPAAAENGFRIDPPKMEQGQLLNLSLIEALATIKEEKLSGVFAFIAEADSSLAFANLLLADSKSRDRFLKACERMHTAAGAISRWDKQVILLLVGMNSQREFPPGIQPMSEKQRTRINKLALIPGVAIEELRNRMATRGKR